MRIIHSIILVCFTAGSAMAQYGTFEKTAVQDARNRSLLVVLDAGDTPYNRAITNAVKAHWKFTNAFDFIRVNDLATQPLDADKLYLMKTAKPDPVKHTGIFLSVVQGWKQKKNEAVVMNENSATNIPAEYDLAFILFDPAKLADQDLTGMLNVYVKHLQDYLGLVENGTVTDKTTTDRTYQSRNRLLRDDLTMLITPEQIDGSMGVDGAKEQYTHAMELVDNTKLNEAATTGQAKTGLADVVLTGDHKNKHCFKRVFNANTGELMYLADEAALFGKKEGFIADDIKALERAR